MDVLLMPDQMMLQIHESIGHPLELDRILGDERNFAGTSFVTLDMFGHYQYGSPLLNVSFAPDLREQFASFAFDDEGAPAQREWIIREGILQRPLGASLSQARAGAMPGVATARACSWNRPPIDRMSNLNIEPGEATLDSMIASIENGILMKTNSSWSIDDSRNKFQFGCEHGQLIRNGKLAGRGQAAQLPRHLRQLLALAVHGGRRQHLPGDGHAVLRQGRAQPGDPGRPCIAGLQVQRRRGVRGSELMQDDFNKLADAVCGETAGGERVSLAFSAEATDFIRFNRAAVRQATHVEQRYGSVSVVADGGAPPPAVSLSGDLSPTRRRCWRSGRWLIASCP
jgi:predicted Zn-dependent protease